MSAITIKPGQIWRDCYGDGKPISFGSAERFRNLRTVRVVEQENDGRWIIEIVTEMGGDSPTGKPRRTRVKEQTLFSGYELQDSSHV